MLGSAAPFHDAFALAVWGAICENRVWQGESRRARSPSDEPADFDFKRTLPLTDLLAQRLAL